MSKKNSKYTNISDFLSSRLHTLSALSAASASLRVERKFSLSLLEWRSLAHLGAFSPLALKELAHRTGMDKSYASRTVASLIERDLITSEKNDLDGRGVSLRLTEKGENLYKNVFKDASARNERLLHSFSDEERKVLMKMLSVLTDRAREVLNEERLIAEGKLKDSDVQPKQIEQEEKTKKSTEDLGEVRLLVERLHKILNN